MKKADHMQLARFLLCQVDDIFLNRHRKLFIFGCIEPDLNPLTYLRGSLKEHFFRGHNAENVQQHIQTSIRKLQSSKQQSAYWYFSLGTLMHYIADSFTYPHNKAFSGGLIKHIAYEKELHKVFECNIRVLNKYSHYINPDSAWSIFADRHKQYEHNLGSMETDCYFIFKSCPDILASLLVKQSTSSIIIC